MMAEESGARDDGSLSRGRSWVLVVSVIVILLVVPAIVWAMTRGMKAEYSIYVGLAMLPGLAFGVIGVWTALRHRELD